LSRNPNILIVGPDATAIRAEFEAALEGFADLRPVVHAVADCRQGVEAARSRHPELVLVEMTKSLRALTEFVEDTASAAPDSVVAAVYRPDVFGPDVSESAVLIEAMRAGVRDFLRRPLSRADLEGLFGRTLGKRPTSGGRLGKVVSFISNKGGVGKSTLAVNVACGLARRQPERVLLIDASLQMGVCAPLLDLQPLATLTDAVKERDRLDETLIRKLATRHHCGLDLLAAPADAIEAARVDDEVMARIVTQARRAYDYVIVDTFPMLDRVMMAVLDLSDRTYIVLDSVVPTVLGAVKLIDLLDELGFSTQRQRVILNRHSRWGASLKPSDVAERLGRTIDYVVPDDKKVLTAANTGRPHILSAGRWFGFGPAVRRIIDDMADIKAQRVRARERPRPEPTANGRPADAAAVPEVLPAPEGEVSP